MSLNTEARSGHHTAPGNHLPSERPVSGHRHLHGKPSSWVFVAVIIAAFVAGAFAIVYGLWWLFWICLGIAFLSVLVGKIINIMGDTVLAGGPAEQVGQEGAVAEDAGSAADPGVDVGPRPSVAPGAPPAVSS